MSIRKNILLSMILIFSSFTSVALADNVAENSSQKDYPTINEGDWRSFRFDSIPWSVPVIAKDDFDGDQLAVMDRRKSGGMLLFGKESGIVSMWAESKIRIYYYLREESKNLFENDKWTIHEADNLSIKVGEKVFRLAGKNGNFQVEDELAKALANAPEGKTKIKIKFEGEGRDTVSEIARETVKSWKTVYGSKELASE